jgi:hypothetical protein
VIQAVNGRGATIFALQPEPAQQQRPDDYGFWSGFIPGGQFLPGVPAKLFPDWDAHRPCIIFDFSGFGIRPDYCVDDGDPLGTPQLYDPSGIIRDALTLQPIAGATVTLLRVPAFLPDTRTTTRDCRTIDTRPGGGAAPPAAVFLSSPASRRRKSRPMSTPRSQAAMVVTAGMS